VSFTPQENNVIAVRFLDSAWNRGEFLEELIAQDAMDHSFVGGKAITEKGNESFRTVVSTFRNAMPDINLTINDEICIGDKVVHLWTLSGTDTGGLTGIMPTGRRVSITGTTIVCLKNGKIVERWSNADELGLLQQLGMIPSPPESEGDLMPERVQPPAVETASEVHHEAEAAPIARVEQTMVFNKDESPPPATMIMGRDVVVWQLVAKDTGKPIILEEVVRLGRNSDNQIVINEPSVSRSHAQIDLKGNECWLTDLNSSNGTFVNDVQVEQPVRLKDKDIVRIGATAAFEVRTMSLGSPPTQKV
jgi:predicted ester cyclase